LVIISVKKGFSILPLAKGFEEVEALYLAYLDDEFDTDLVLGANEIK
jgi:hypothetical protein